jgi:hypothetical protein
MAVNSAAFGRGLLTPQFYFSCFKINLPHVALALKNSDHAQPAGNFNVADADGPFQFLGQAVEWRG